MNVAADLRVGGVFISHASADKTMATHFKNMLVLGGVPQGRIFFSSERTTGIPTGDAFASYIRQRLGQAAIVVQLVSPAFLASHFCLLELGGQWALQTKSFPIAVPPLTPRGVGEQLGGLQVGTLDDEDTLAELRDVLEAALELRLPTAAWNSSVRTFRDRTVDERQSTDATAHRLPIRAVPSVLSVGGDTVVRGGFDNYLTNSYAGRFAAADQNTPAVHLRAVWRPHVERNASIWFEEAESFLATVPTGLFDLWSGIYRGRGHVGSVDAPELEEHTGSRNMVAAQNYRIAGAADPAMSVRSAVSVSEIGLMFVADLSLAVDDEALPFEPVLESMHRLAGHVALAPPAWLSERFNIDLPRDGVLELHARARGARPKGGRDSLDGYIDLTLLGQRRRSSDSVSVSAATALASTDDAVLASAVADAWTRPRMDWGYYGAPQGLHAKIRELLTAGSRASADRPTLVVAAPAAGSAAPAALLEAELASLCGSAEAQGWQVRRTSTAVRLTTRSGKRLTFSIAADSAKAREDLREFARTTRANGLRVSHRIRASAT